MVEHWRGGAAAHPSPGSAQGGWERAGGNGPRSPGALGMSAARARPIREAFNQKHQVNTFFQHDQRRLRTGSQTLLARGTPGQSSIQAGQLPGLPPAALLASGLCSGHWRGQGAQTLTCVGLPGPLHVPLSGPLGALLGCLGHRQRRGQGHARTCCHPTSGEPRSWRSPPAERSNTPRPRRYKRGLLWP